MDDLNSQELSDRLLEEGKEHMQEMGLEPSSEPEPSPEPELKPDVDDKKVQPSEEKKSSPDGSKPKGGGETPAGNEDKLDPKIIAELKEGKIIPHSRFNEVLQELKQYKTLGSLEDIKNKIEGALTKGDGNLTDEDRKVRDYILDKIAPELKTVLRESQMGYESFKNKALKKIDDFSTKEIGLDPKNVKALSVTQHTIAEIIKSTPEYARRFYEERDPSVIEDAIKEYKDTFLAGVKRTNTAEILESKKKTNMIPKPLGKGMIPPSGNPPKGEDGTFDWDKVGNEAFESLQEGLSKS